MPADYLFLWKPTGDWPASYADELLRRFAIESAIVEDWRCGSFNKIRPGDRAYVFAQADHHRCIFAVGTVDGPAKEKPPGWNLPPVPLRLDMMAHPDAGSSAPRLLETPCYTSPR